MDIARYRFGWNDRESIGTLKLYFELCKNIIYYQKFEDVESTTVWDNNCIAIQTYLTKTFMHNAPIKSG